MSILRPIIDQNYHEKSFVNDDEPKLDKRAEPDPEPQRCDNDFSSSTSKNKDEVCSTDILFIELRIYIFYKSTRKSTLNFVLLLTLLLQY